MLMHRLPLVIVLRMKLAVRSGDGLRRLIRFKPQIPRLVLPGKLVVPHAAVAQHQVVMRLQVFRVDGQHLQPRLSVVKANLFMRHGSYSQALMQADVNNITALYQSNGFNKVKITPEVKHSGAQEGQASTKVSG